MKKTILALLFIALINEISFSQINICDSAYKKKSDLESNLCMQVYLSGLATNIRVSTSNMQDGSYYVNAKNKSVLFSLAATTIGLKANKNQSWALFYALVYDNNKHLMTDSAYVGYSKWEYGEEAEQVLMKVKKRRIYPENNIFTESITISNGITFIVESRMYIKKITFPDGQIANIPDYNYED